MFTNFEGFFTILILSLTIELAMDDIRVALGLRNLYKNNVNDMSKILEVVLPTKGSQRRKSDFYLIPLLIFSICIFLLERKLFEVNYISHIITLIGLLASVFSKHYSNKVYKKISA